MRPSRPILFQLSVACALALPTSAQACAACFGKSDSPMAQGMNMGIFALLLVIVSVLIGIASFFFYIIRRASRLAAASGAPGGAATAPTSGADLTSTTAGPDAAPLPQPTQ